LTWRRAAFGAARVVDEAPGIWKQQKQLSTSYMDKWNRKEKKSRSPLAKPKKKGNTWSAASRSLQTIY